MEPAVWGRCFNEPKSLIISGSRYLIIGIVPGMPHFAFLLLGEFVPGA